MVDLMNLLSDVLIGGFQMLMLNDLGKNMFSYRIKTYWTRILIYGVTALVILGVNHIESTFINIMMVPVSYTIASIVIFQGSVWKKIILACCYYMLAIVPEFLFLTFFAISIKRLKITFIQSWKSCCHFC